MTYFALARRWRPQTFAEVAAQSHVTETLLKAIESGRVASAYLFSGPRGSGKTTAARLLAKAVNCDQPKAGEPCGKCTSCLAIAEGRSLDVLEIDGASNNSVDDVRELRESVRYAPSVPGKRKIYIVDEVHMLSTGAFNALLKTLEEPPAHVVFVFATTEARKVPATILSRCQRFDFRRLHVDEIRARLAHIVKHEKLDLEPDALFLLAKRADGSLRDGLSLLDQVLSSTSGTIRASQVAEILGVVPEDLYFDLTTAIRARDAARALGVLHTALRAGSDPASFALGVVEHLRNLMLLAVDPELRGNVTLGEVHLRRAEELSREFSREDLLYLLQRAAAVHDEVRRASQPSVVLEAALVEMAHFESRVALSELLERMGGPGPGAPPAGAGSGTAASARGVAAGGRTASGRGGARAETELTGLPMDPAAARVETPAVLDATPLPAIAVPARIAASAVLPLAAGGPRPASASVAPRAAGSSAAATVVALDLEVVRARWTEFTQALRASKAMLAHCLAEGQPVRFESGKLEVWFAPEQNFHQHLFEDALRKRELEPYLKAFFGRAMQVGLAPATSRPADGAAIGIADGTSAGTVTTTATSGAARLTTEDVLRGRRDALADVVERTPGLDDIITAFDGEVLDDSQPDPR